MQLPLSEMAQRLNLPLTTLLRWIRQGHIPLRQVDDTCDFNPAALARWAQQHHLTFCLDIQACDADSTATAPNLLSAMQRGGVYHDIEGQTVAEVFRQAIARLSELPDQTTAEELLAILLAREALASTGVGQGVAIPHPRRPLVSVLPEARISTFFLKEPVDFNAVDGQPVFVMFFLFCPCVRSHLLLLSQLSFCVRNADFVVKLRARPSSTVFYSAIAVCVAQATTGI